MMNKNGYVKLRRGLGVHFQIMKPIEVTVYVALLILADFQTGIVKMSIRDLSAYTNIGYKEVSLAVRRLDAMDYIIYTPSPNQWVDSMMEIIKYASGEKPEPIPEPIPEPTLQHTPLEQQKGAPKNLKKYKNSNTELTQKLIDHYHDEFVKKFGDKPQITVDGCKTLKKLGEDYGEEKAANIIGAYLKDNDEYIKSNGYPIRLLQSRVNAYLVKAKKDVGVNYL